MSNSTKLVPVELDDLAFLILCAGRYCEGRTSYAPSMLRTIVRTYWDKLLTNHRNIFIKDHVKYLEDIKKWYPDIHYDYSYKEWSRFIAELAEIDRIIDAGEDTYTDDSHGIDIILGMLLDKAAIKPSQCEAAYKVIKDKLDDEGMWVGDDDHEAERFISFYGDEVIEAITNQN